MKVLICGAGIIGFNLAKYLALEGHEVELIELSESVAGKAHEKLDVRVIVGSAADPEVLEKAGVGTTELVVAVTDSDLSNLAITSLAAAYGSGKRIARVRDTSLFEAINRFGLAHFYVDEIINPDEVTAQAIYKVLSAPGSREVADFVGGEILLRSFDVKEQSSLCQVKLSDLRDQDFPWPFLVVAISREDTVTIPKGEDTIQPGDRIYVLLPKNSLAEFLTFIDAEVKLPKKVIIFGATNTGEALAGNLVPRQVEVILLEDDLVRAEEVAGRLNGVRVINGPATEADILLEAGVEAADVFIGVSASDRSNIISAVLAKRKGAKTTIVTTDQPDYLSIVGTLGIDAVVNPRFIAVDQILRLVRGGRISHVASLPETHAEVLELIPEPGSPVTRKAVKDLKFPPNSILGAVHRGDEVILADGNTHVRAGERVVVFCDEDAVPKLQKLFSSRKGII
jgi:trk system potassium uptake protein TrkA